jgi:hypothetical protein
MRQALELALEALQVATTPLAKDRQEVLQAITAIKEALAQPEQEPVAEGWCNGCNPDNCQGCGPAAKPKHEPIFWYRPVGEDGDMKAQFITEQSIKFASCLAYGNLSTPPHHSAHGLG